MKQITLFFLLLNSSLSFAQVQESTARMILLQQAALTTINSSDIAGSLITDNYTSLGVSHVYFKQQVDGIEIHESSFAIHGIRPNFKFVKGHVIQGLSNLQVDNGQPITALNAIENISRQKTYDVPLNPKVIHIEPGASNKKTVLQIENVSSSNIPARLVYYVQDKSSLKLAWEIEIDDLKSADYINFIVDAQTGLIIKEYNYTVSCGEALYLDQKEDHNSHTHHAFENHSSSSNEILGLDSSYNVFKWPIEAPHNGDRTIEVSPWNDNLIASPNGWHTAGLTVSKGNNVDAYIDDDSTNSPTGGNAARADGGSNLDFDFALDTAGNPAVYRDAAITNLFYWNNLIHDVWFNYGFDEPSGNFQSFNFTETGLGNDYVKAEAQDGGNTCNAFMTVPTDGISPRLQMNLCNGRDGDFDNAVMVHEISHGFSLRLTGGPGTSSCISGQEHMGEGWSDYFGIVMTIEPGDMGSDSRGLGTWLLGQGPDGPGVRIYPYSTDLNVNPFTYDSIKVVTGTVSHGVGSVWATMLWDVTWSLIDEHGWDSDIYNGAGGNNIAMKLVMEGLKLQPCVPGFVDGRDAILLADDILNEGANKCLLWEAFAARGLGFSADQGLSSSRFDGTEAFDLPPDCLASLNKTVDLIEVDAGDTIMYTFKAKNKVTESILNLTLSDPLPDNTIFLSASNGGTLNASFDTVIWPPFTLLAGDSIEYTMDLRIDSTIETILPDFLDDMESGLSNWSTNNTGPSQFNLTSSDASSGIFSWFAINAGSSSVANLLLASPVGITSSSVLSFTHKYDTENTKDGGVIEISTDGGEVWQDVASHFVTNGYNSTIHDSRPAFSGDSNGFITSSVNLAAFAGQIILIRFQMNCDEIVSGVGWWVDDVSINELVICIPNIANLSNGFIDEDGILLTPTKVISNPYLLAISMNKTDVSCFESMDGAATVIASSGSGIYSYLWDSGATTASISNLAPGTYGVTVQDGILIRSDSVIITQPDNLDLVMSAINDYGGSTGSASVLVSGGTPDYNYLWGDGEMTSTIDGLDQGIYEVQVTDLQGCVNTASIQVKNPIDCPEKNVIRINIQFDQFAEEITLFVRDDNSNILFETPFTSAFSGKLISAYVCVENECYTVEIVDSNGDGICNAGSNPLGYYEIVDGKTETLIHTGCDIGPGVIEDICYPLLSAIISQTDPSCSGISDGEIHVTAIDGSGSYTYDYGTGDTGSSALNLSPGNYSVVVNDGITSITEQIIIHNSLATVYKNTDLGPGSLRYAIEESCSQDTITFDAILMGDTIILQSKITIFGTKVIEGLAVTDLIISGNNSTQIFNATNGSNLSLRNLNLIDADAPAPGGAIFNKKTLHLFNILLKNNKENGIGKAWSGDGDVFLRGVIILQE